MADFKPHPLIPAPGYEEIAAEAHRRRCSMEQALAGLLRKRDQVIAREQRDPYRYGWEPSMWLVPDALLDWPWVSEPARAHIQARFGWTWEQWKQEMRTLLGYPQPARYVLVLGANRSSKSEFMAKRGQQMLSEKDMARVYPMHMSHPRSRAEQQPLFWRYMPLEFKQQTKTEQEYISDKAKTGFSESSFINPRESWCQFINYMQDMDTALEGLEGDLALPDELLPVDWFGTLKYRMATRGGMIIVGFTPIHGYTPTVKVFCDGAQPVREAVAFMLPTDGGDPDRARTLGLTERELTEAVNAELQKRAARTPQSRPEDVHAWLEEAGRGPGQAATADFPRPFGYAQAQPAVPEGRRFAKMPRVMRCMDPRMAVVFFHGCDNPYGNPKNVLADAAASRAGRPEIEIRCYGFARRTAFSVLTKFDAKVHTLKPEDVPQGDCNWMLMDPHGDRNFFMGWIRSMPEAAYVYREWPGRYEVPGHGIPGPWAIPSGRKEGRNDGDRGDGQESFGFGLLRYKFEIARLERWEAFFRWCHDAGKTEGLEEPDALRAVLDGWLYPDDDDLMEWDERDGADEPTAGRLVDSRAASSPRIENDRPVTLQTDLANIGLDFDLAPAKDVEHGIRNINSALDYDRDQEGSFFNHPKLYISTACPNTIYSCENWLNVEGDKGPCKDPIDILRWYYCAGCSWEEQAAPRARGGVGYGARRAPTGYERRKQLGLPAPRELRGRVRRAIR